MRFLVWLRKIIDRMIDKIIEEKYLILLLLVLVLVYRSLYNTYLKEKIDNYFFQKRLSEAAVEFRSIYDEGEEIAAYVRDSEGTRDEDLWLVDEEGNEVKMIHFKRHSGPQFMYFSPDQQYLFWADDSGIVRLTPTQGELKTIYDKAPIREGLNKSSNRIMIDHDKLYYYDIPRSRIVTIKYRDPVSVVASIDGPNSDFDNYLISPDRKRAFFERDETLVREMTPEEKKEYEETRMLVGKKLLFDQVFLGRNLYIKVQNLATGDFTEIPKVLGKKETGRLWSSDSRSVLYTLGNELYAFDVETEETKLLAKHPNPESVIDDCMYLSGVLFCQIGIGETTQSVWYTVGESVFKEAKLNLPKVRDGNTYPILYQERGKIFVMERIDESEELGIIEQTRTVAIVDLEGNKKYLITKAGTAAGWNVSADFSFRLFAIQ